MAPTTLGVPLCSQLTVTQVRAAMPAAVFVTTMALAGQAVSAEGGSAVEAEPAEPKQSGTDDGQPDVMRLEPLGLAAHSRTQHEGRDECRHTRADVDDGAAGEVDGAQLVEPAALAQTQWAIGE